MLPDSNFGVPGVDVAAKAMFLSAIGTALEERNPSGPWAWVGQTSEAAPNVANIVALMRSICPDLSGAELKALFMSCISPDSRWSGKVVAGGVVDRERCFAAAVICAKTLRSGPARGSDPDAEQGMAQEARCSKSTPGARS
jgi:hypothetical protein